MDTSLVADDVMTPEPRSTGPATTVGQALAILQSLDARHLPIVNPDHELLGMLSDRDLRRSLESAATESPPSGWPEGWPVSRVMSSDVRSVSSGASLHEVVETMLDHKVGALPVVDAEGRLVGIVSYIDLLRLLERELQ